MRDFRRYIRTRPSEFRAQTFLRGRPQNVAVFVAQADGCVGFVFTLATVVRFVIGQGAAAGDAADFGRDGIACFADGIMAAHALIGVEGVGESFIVGGTFENGVGAGFVVGQEEEFGGIKAGDDEFAQGHGLCSAG